MSTESLNFKSGLDDTKFQAGMRRMETSAERAAVKISEGWGRVGSAFGAVGAAVTATGIVIKNVVDFASDLGDSAEAINLSVESFQGFVGVLEAGGVTQEKFERAMVKLTQSIQDARDGNVKIVETFEKLGVTWEKIISLSPEEILNEIAAGLSSATDSTEAFAAATDLFGKGSAKMIAQLKENGTALKENAAEVSKLSQAQQKTLDDWGDAWVRWARKVKVAIGGTIATAASDLQQLAEDAAFLYSINDMDANELAQTIAANGGSEGTPTTPAERGGDITDPRTKKQYEELDKALEQMNKDSAKWHEETQRALDKVAEFDAKIAKEIRESDERFREKQIENKRDKIAQLQQGISAEMAREVDFNLTTPDERREAHRSGLDVSRANSRAKRELAALKDPSRRFKDSRAFGNELGGDLGRVALDEASITKLTNEIAKLIVAP